MRYLGWLGPRWLGLVAYLAAASLWYYAVVTVLDSYRTVCQLDRGPFLVKMGMYSAQNFLIWIAPLIVARSTVAVWINNAFGLVVFSAAILFAISSHNVPECTTVTNRGIDSSGWFEFGTTDNFSTFICYVVTAVDLIRWARSKAKRPADASQ